MALNVCLISSEVTPLSKTGGLADVSGSLAKYLHGAGHDVRVFTPLYSAIDRSKLSLRAVEFLQDVALELGPHRYRYSVFAGHLPGSTAIIYLIDCPVLYSRKTIYTTDVDEHLRFLVLTRAAFECCQRMSWSPDILHCNDWHTAFGPLYLKAVYDWDRLFAQTRAVLTIHNIGYQGVFPAHAAGDLGLGAKSYLLHQDDLRAGFVNSLKHGILYADAITTVSPTHHLVDALAQPLEQGRIKVFSVDGSAARTWLRGTVSPEDCARTQSLYDAYVDTEVVPLIRRDCHSETIEIVAAGAAIGAYAAISALVRLPSVFRVAIALSGIFDLSKYLVGGFTPALAAVSPLHALPTVTDEAVRRRFAVLATGEGAYEQPAESERMSAALGAAHVSHQLEKWGPHYAHGWNTWREMLPRYVNAHA